MRTRIDNFQNEMDLVMGALIVKISGMGVSLTMMTRALRCMRIMELWQTPIG